MNISRTYSDIERRLSGKLKFLEEKKGVGHQRLMYNVCNYCKNIFEGAFDYLCCLHLGLLDVRAFGLNC